MKNSFDKLLQKTVGTSKKVAVSAKENVGTVIEKAKLGAMSRKLKKLNPVFPEQYRCEEFNLPNIIMIVDDAVRKNEKLCEGAIGWLETINEVEVLCLYDEAIEFSLLKFIPAPTCDAIYYVDNFDRNKFVRTDFIFSKAHEEKIAELKHIAFCLGAKRCYIELSEARTDSKTQETKASAKESAYGKKVQESFENTVSQSTSDLRSGKNVIEFENNTNCTMPELKWFSYDDNIKRLIEMRLGGSCTVKSETLELVGASSATMSQKTARAIDCVVGEGELSLSTQAEKEYHSKLIYHVEF